VSWTSGLTGLNASQVTLTSSSATSVSNGYAGYALGGGFSYSPFPMVAAEADLLFSQRKFGFNGSKNSFPAVQVPLLAHCRFMRFYGGAGLYGAMWSFNGELVKGSTTSKISPAKAGQETLEMGFAVDFGMNYMLMGIPLRFDFRRLQSFNDITKSSSLKGKIVEYQLMMGYNLGVGGKK
jgi:hypothetical protein